MVGRSHNRAASMIEEGPGGSMTGPPVRTWIIVAAVLLAALSAGIVSSLGVATIGAATASAQTGTRVVNANDYSSHGHLAIQAAIDDVNSTGGGAVYVPAGIHLLQEK